MSGKLPSKRTQLRAQSGAWVIDHRPPKRSPFLYHALFLLLLPELRRELAQKPVRGVPLDLFARGAV